MVCHFGCREINGKNIFIHENTKTHRFDVEIREDDETQTMNLSKKQGQAVLSFVEKIIGIDSVNDGRM